MKKYILPGAVLAAVLVLLLVFLPRGRAEKTEAAPTLPPSETAAPTESPETEPEREAPKETATETPASEATEAPVSTEEPKEITAVKKHDKQERQGGGRTEKATPTPEPPDRLAPTPSPTPPARSVTEISIDLVQRNYTVPMEDMTDPESYELPETELR